jgi:hypothetical protein
VTKVTLENDLAIMRALVRLLLARGGQHELQARIAATEGALAAWAVGEDAAHQACAAGRQ